MYEMGITPAQILPDVRSKVMTTHALATMLAAKSADEVSAVRTQEMRSELRIPVSQRGTLQAGEDSYPCLVQDMSTQGFFFVSSREHTVGQALGFKCAFAPEKLLECKVEVRHVSDMGMGAKIVEIDEKGANLCQLYLQEQYADKLNRSG